MSKTIIQYIIQKANKSFISVFKNKDSNNRFFVKYFSKEDALMKTGIILPIDSYLTQEKIKEINSLRKDLQSIAKFWIERASKLEDFTMFELEYIDKNIFVES